MAELAAFCRKELAPYGFDTILVDDQWQGPAIQKGGLMGTGPTGNFTRHDPKGPYPSGIKANADKLAARGLRAGLWFTPFSWDPRDPLFKDHQDWFVKKEDGSLYEVLWAGWCLDMTHPEARAFLADSVRRIHPGMGLSLPETRRDVVRPRGQLHLPGHGLRGRELRRRRVSRSVDDRHRGLPRWHPLKGLVVIDEVQRKPELFPVLRVLSDRRSRSARFLLLGSASPDLIRESSESLAGRVEFVDMAGFNLDETGADSLRTLWWRGGFPRSFLAESDAASRAWRENFIQTFLERDIRMFGVQVPPMTLRRLWQMLAHYHGQIWNASDVSRSLGEAHTTVKRHLDILTGALMVRQLPPWFENLGKRQVKSPKVYLRDSGVLHELLGVGSFARLEGHPKLGASWEGFVIEEVLRVTGDRQAYFWGTHSGHELDLLVFVNGRRLGVEVKYGDAVSVTPSMRVALADLELERLWVVHPGRQSYPLAPKAEAVSIGEVRERLAKL